MISIGVAWFACAVPLLFSRTGFSLVRTALLLACGPPLIVLVGEDGAWSTNLRVLLLSTSIIGGAITAFRKPTPLRIIIGFVCLLAWFGIALLELEIGGS